MASYISRSKKGVDLLATANSNTDIKKGRGAQMNTGNRFLAQHYEQEHPEAIDEWETPDPKTQFISIEAKTLVNKVESPDVGMAYSMNPYNGCEHGCIYCYARNSHEYWGYSAGIDFETKIMVKENAPQLLRKFLMHRAWNAVPLSLSGNTDCYQPAEQKFRLTRGLLEVCAEFNQPVGILTKNAGVLRDMDILQPMAQKRLASVLLTITSLNEDLRRVLEPRTATAAQRLRTVERMSKAGIQTGVMLGPIIPGLNDHETPAILEAAAAAGATFAGYTFIRLNGAIKLLFYDWLQRHFPDRAAKVWHMIEASHGGQVNNSEWGSRMRGEGPVADMIAAQFKTYLKKFGLNKEKVSLDSTQFYRPGEQGKLF
ncbi:PA0069 family radical SAM protein [Paracnuella aquatica]|uniref:PA0069 family radical SAM protein n=1 Tax=Paracnuella aquatica TaxID=2268757 RepID=UPI000DEF98F5|nr:PA0069 family radical SAM protein [Paracnuella aquatica]RPD43522.1 PA0069 family radical SAM protein [Paracnuella aquatica]